MHIRDQGQGIAAQDLARLFEPFARVGVATRGDVGGAGLGLAFVRTVAQRHGGEVEVTSEAGVGSVFTPVSYTHLDVYKRQGEGR